MAVHPTAIVSPRADLASTAEVGPFCVVGDDVVLSEGCHLLAHAVVLGPTRLGQGNRVFPFATLGAAPQDLSYRGEPTLLEVGNGNEFREGVTVHRGTVKGGGTTRLGSHSLFMTGSHVAHDCVVGSRVVLTNLATLGGHVTVADSAVLGGHVAVAPFVRVGRGAFIAGGARVERDVPPFMIAAGDRARIRAPNRVGQRRLGVPEDSRRALKAAFRLLWGRRGSFGALVELEARLGQDIWVAELIDFLRTGVHQRP